MTTLDHPDVILSDKRDLIMDAVRGVIGEDRKREAEKHERLANHAIDACLPRISQFLEDYGTDPTNGIVYGPCSDPGHALAWVTTAAGFSFDVVDSRHEYWTADMPLDAGVECWLLHPLTGERVYRIDYQATWENAARAIHAADQAAEDPFTEPELRIAGHPAEALVDALRAFIESMGSRDVGF